MTSGGFSLQGKNAVVTGAGAGIGRAIALAFVQAGAQVACIDLDEKAAEATAGEIAKNGAHAIGVTCDVGVENDVEAAAAKVLAAFPSVHVLVNGAAGHDPNGSVLEYSLADWNRVMTVNVGGAFMVSRAFLPAMIAAGGGSIIHIASQMGSVAAPRRAAYCTSKGALIQLAKAMATDHAAQNIRVNTLSPGAIRDQPAGETLRRHGNGTPRVRAEASARPSRATRRNRRGCRLSCERCFAIHDRRRPAG
ncbi:MAG: SDR family oxidoreductase [Alphaproteobacteria bacterium]